MLEEGCESGIQKPNGGGKNMKYCLIAGDAPKEDEQLVMSGLFAWKHAFDRCGGNGEYTTNLSREFLEEYELHPYQLCAGDGEHDHGCERRNR